MINAPSKFEHGRYPGVVTRYEDFVAVHINQTGTIHGTGNFLSWHRYYVWAYEKALREECGYKGAQPVCLDMNLFLRRVHS
jgi:tyrosinase